ncbi:MAG: methyltransferase domain-containing protein [Nitrospira sp.]|nr:methyltransferase domain-containing protein [Nitrospira sp.]
MQIDQKTADAFATSWNNLPKGSVYTRDQFEDWLAPVSEGDVSGKSVLELGCGNGSLMMHMAGWAPSRLEGVDLGDSVQSAIENMSATGFSHWKVTRADLTEFVSDGFDLVYSIGVLHHLKDPKKGFDAVLRNVKSGGRFHCWVYAKEGNALIIYLVDPIRKVASRLPWWINKYLIATPLVVPYFLYAKLLSRFRSLKILKKLPLYDYSIWIAKREFAFFRHVAFDQLVTPQTSYIDRQTIESWLHRNDRIDPGSTYIIMRNGNSWKFGGRCK